jgi:hypothetical protein
MFAADSHIRRSRPLDMAIQREQALVLNMSLLFSMRRVTCFTSIILEQNGQVYVRHLRLEEDPFVTAYLQVAGLVHRLHKEDGAHIPAQPSLSPQIHWPFGPILCYNRIAGRRAVDICLPLPVTPFAYLR